MPERDVTKLVREHIFFECISDGSWKPAAKGGAYVIYAMCVGTSSVKDVIINCRRDITDFPMGRSF